MEDMICSLTLQLNKFTRFLPALLLSSALFSALLSELFELFGSPFLLFCSFDEFFPSFGADFEPVAASEFDDITAVKNRENVLRC